MSNDTRYPAPRVDVYQDGRLRSVPRVAPALTCYCGGKLKPRFRPDIGRGMDFLPCHRCNASFYVIANEQPFMEVVDRGE